jgi:hypothetical protein
MSLPSLLLRVLLGLSLVLNGTGSVLASAHQSLAGLPAAAAAEGHAAPGSPQLPAACHEGNAEAGGPVPATAAAGANADLHDSGPGSECCDPGSCRCPCLHGFCAAVSMTAGDPMAPMQQVVRQALATGHDTPALPHLIRPPIG